MQNESIAPLSQSAVRALASPPPGAWMPVVESEDINWASGYPFPKAVPVEGMSRAWRQLMAGRDQAFQYLGARGQGYLRDWVMERTRDLRLAEDDFILTMGAIQGIDLAVRAVVDQGQSIVVQSPTYMEALEVFQNYTAHIVGVPLENRRFPIETVRRIIYQQKQAGHPVAAIYWQADFQNPTGVTTGLADRRALVELAAENGVWLIEDAAYRDLSFGEPLTSLKTLSSDSPVIHLGTLSKTVGPGLRIGWAVGSRHVVQAMDRMKKDLGHPLSEALVGEWLHDTDYAAHLQSLRASYQQRAEAMAQALDPLKEQGLIFESATGGYFMWLDLPEPWTSDSFTAQVRQRQLVVLSGRHFLLPGVADPRAVRVSFSYAPLTTFSEGARRLGETLKEATQGAEGRGLDG